MTVCGSAPGKLVLLGEYVVLDGSPGLVAAIDRRAKVTLAESAIDRCRLRTLMPALSVLDFAPGRASGSSLVDSLAAEPELYPPWPGFNATIDTSEFFLGSMKLGLGSSAAALVAFAGTAWTAAKRAGKPDVWRLIRCHRAFQGGAGSGIDVAAAALGGVLQFALDADSRPLIGSVALPKSVGFAGIFAGGSASTPDLVGQYRRWVGSGSPRAAALQQHLIAVAERGCAAVNDDDAEAFVAAVGEYGRGLLDLGQEMGVDLVTREHRDIGDLARDFGLAYKVSGAGGGDVGIACGLDADALEAFMQRAADDGFSVVPLAVDAKGLEVEEHAE